MNCNVSTQKMRRVCCTCPTSHLLATSTWLQRYLSSLHINLPGCIHMLHIVHSIIVRSLPQNSSTLGPNVVTLSHTHCLTCTVHAAKLSTWCTILVQVVMTGMEAVESNEQWKATQTWANNLLHTGPFRAEVKRALLTRWLCLVLEGAAIISNTVTSSLF